MIVEVFSLGDVIIFFEELFKEGVNAHPDEDFSQYINNETNEATFTQQEAELRNKLMVKSFKICDAAEIDIYDLMQEIYLKETGLDQFIPLPSQKEFE